MKVKLFTEVPSTTAKKGENYRAELSHDASNSNDSVAKSSAFLTKCCVKFRQVFC